MPLAMQKFFSFQPHLPFRFKVEFFFSENDLKMGENFTYFVKSVKLPVMEPGEGEGTIFLGNGILSIPLFNPASREISITFEENDYMDIVKLIDLLNYFAYRFNNFSQIIIGITEYKTDMNTPLRRKAYCVRFKGYDEPQFSNAGGVNLVTTSLTFKVDSEIGNWDGQEISIKESAEKIDLLTTSVDAVELKDLVAANFGGRKSLTDEQKTRLNDIFEAAKRLGLLDSTTDSLENWEKRFEQQLNSEKGRLAVDADTALNNAYKLIENVGKLKSKLNKEGYDVKLAGETDDFGAIFGVHAENSQHNKGNKVDLKISKGGKDIDIASAEGKTALETLKKVNTDGLVKTAVGEKGAGTGWIDVNFTGSDWNKGYTKGIVTDSYYNTKKDAQGNTIGFTQFQ